MNIPIDIHTHHLPAEAGTAIVNCLPQDFRPQPGGWYSVGIHPWTLAGEHMRDSVAIRTHDPMQQLATQSPSLDYDFLLRLLQHPQVLAVGEAGLDKLTAAPLSLQTEVFRRQAVLAEEVGKPLIIHLVKAVDELLKLKRELHPSVPWIIHGFRGKAALASELLRHGFYLSFGEKYQAEALRLPPTNRLLLETDESRVPIDTLYEQAALVRGISVEECRKSTEKTINMVFFRQ
ncbi:MAG: TatD family hydrolase [Bacteroides sp.]|nr:TatD family hydrolase [Bacteroides sp.]